MIIWFSSTWFCSVCGILVQNKSWIESGICLPPKPVSILRLWHGANTFQPLYLHSSSPLSLHLSNHITLPPSPHSLLPPLSAMKRIIDARPPSGRLLQALCSAPLILAVAGDNFITARFVAYLVCLTQPGVCVYVCVFILGISSFLSLLGNCCGVALGWTSSLRAQIAAAETHTLIKPHTLKHTV